VEQLNLQNKKEKRNRPKSDNFYNWSSNNPNPGQNRRKRMKDYHINLFFYSDEDECYVADIPDLKFVPSETPQKRFLES
jgi:hypothetical protein